MSIDKEAFRQRWIARWPGARAGDHWWFDRILRRSLFFSSLPQSKIDAESAVEYAESLRRHHDTVGELLDLSSLSRDTPLILITRSWSQSPEPVQRDDWLDRFVPAEYLDSFTQDPPGETDDEPSWAHIFLTESGLAESSLASLLLLVAGDVTVMTAITTPSLAWLYEPYRNGGAIWGISEKQADQLAERHPDWLPVERELPRQALDQDTPGWEFFSWLMPKSSAERLREVAEAEDLLVANGRLIDPRAELSIRFGRDSAQLLKVVLSDKSGIALDPHTGEPREFTPPEARTVLDDYFSLDGQLDEFLLEYGYRSPKEAVDGKLDGRFWDPSEDYSGIDGTSPS